MSPERFKELLDELDGNSIKTLTEKNAMYSQNGDSLHNFRSGAEIMGRTPAQTCWGYMTKHLTALRDMVEKDDFSNREDFLEKCQDTINYIRFLWCIGNDYRMTLDKIVDEFNSATTGYLVPTDELKMMIKGRYVGNNTITLENNGSALAPNTSDVVKMVKENTHCKGDN